MPSNESIRKLFFICLASMGILGAVWFAMEDLKYTFWGVTTEADVTKTFPDIIRHDDRLVVEYSFTDTAGQIQSERDDVSFDWPVLGPKVFIQYISGVNDSSRIKGNRNIASMILVMINLLITGFSCFELYKLT